MKLIEKWIINVKIDKRKLPISILLRAYGLESNAEILDTFKELGEDVIWQHISPTLEKDKTKQESKHFMLFIKF